MTCMVDEGTPAYELLKKIEADFQKQLQEEKNYIRWDFDYFLMMLRNRISKHQKSLYKHIFRRVQDFLWEYKDKEGNDGYATPHLRDCLSRVLGVYMESIEKEIKNTILDIFSESKKWKKLDYEVKGVVFF